MSPKSGRLIRFRVWTGVALLCDSLSLTAERQSDSYSMGSPFIVWCDQHPMALAHNRSTNRRGAETGAGMEAEGETVGPISCRNHTWLTPAWNDTALFHAVLVLWEDANGSDLDPRVEPKANALCDAERPTIC